MNIVAIIPCLNTAKTIGGVLVKTKPHCKRVIVVDNNSSDDTREEAEKVVPVYDIFECYSKGVGITTGYGMAFSLNPHIYGDVMVTLDGDGQHDGGEIPAIVEPIKCGQADIVIGSRFLRPNRIPKYRRLGINIITWLYNVGSKQKVTDSQSAYRAYSRQAMKKVMPIKEFGFAYSVETLVKARMLGFRIVEVPISCIYHKNLKDNSSQNPVWHGLSVAWGVIKWRIKLELLSILGETWGDIRS